jgi:hypothetical protein
VQACWSLPLFCAITLLSMEVPKVVKGKAVSLLGGSPHESMRQTHTFLLAVESGRSLGMYCAYTYCSPMSRHCSCRSSGYRQRPEQGRILRYQRTRGPTGSVVVCTHPQPRANMRHTCLSMYCAHHPRCTVSSSGVIGTVKPL